MSTHIHSIDQLGNTIQINFPPRKIISLVPSQTEFLFDIGLYDEIAGITRFCIHPSNKVKMKEVIGGTKKFNIEKIKSLTPDLIIGNKEENYKKGIDELSKHFPVWMSDIYNLDDAFDMMIRVSEIVNRKAEGEKLLSEISLSFEKFKPLNAVSTVAYFIWRKPYMVAAGNTFIDNMLSVFGVKNVFSAFERYPEIEPEKLAELKPNFIFLSSEPYRFTEKHIEEFNAYSPNSKVVLVDGEMFSWYGSRLRFAPEYFLKLWQKLEA